MARVLIVEDSPAMRGMLSSIVSQLDDCEVLEVGSGFDALRSLPRERVDLILTDINMPDINGLELISFERSNPNFEITPVIVVSSEGSSRDREKALGLGANAYVTKPFEPDDLLALVRKFLQR